MNTVDAIPEEFFETKANIRICNVINVHSPNFDVQKLVQLTQEQIDFLVKLQVGIGVHDLNWTDAQIKAVTARFEISPDGADDFNDFLQRWETHSDGMLSANWCDMYIGVETDGYAHS